MNNVESEKDQEIKKIVDLVDWDYELRLNSKIKEIMQEKDELEIEIDRLKWEL